MMRNVLAYAKDFGVLIIRRWKSRRSQRMG